MRRGKWKWEMIPPTALLWRAAATNGRRKPRGTGALGFHIWHRCDGVVEAPAPGLKAERWWASLRRIDLADLNDFIQPIEAVATKPQLPSPPLVTHAEYESHPAAILCNYMGHQGECARWPGMRASPRPAAT